MRKLLVLGLLLLALVILALFVSVDITPLYEDGSMAVHFCIRSMGCSQRRPQ